MPNLIVVVTLIVGVSYSICFTFFESVFRTRIFGIRSTVVRRNRSGIASRGSSCGSVTLSLNVAPSLVPIAINTVAFFLKFTDLMIKGSIDLS